jgi:hypothetical protein
MGIYVVTTAAMQAVFFLFSQMVDTQWPAASMLTFLILFMAAFGLAWPIAVRITEGLIRRAGYVVETEQSGGASRTDHLTPGHRRR